MGLIDLGLEQPAFWRLTFYLFFVLYERFVDYQKREDARAGVICSVLGNIHKKKGRKGFEPGDFFPSLKKPKKEMHWEEQLAFIRKLNAALGGRTLSKG